MFALGFLTIVIGYLLGSILPAYFIGRLRGIDIRREGQGNPGAENTYHVLGLWPAAVTATYDVLKGVAAMGIAYALKVDPVFIYMSGIAALIGHVFPFYLGFTGGQGAAASSGLIMAYVAILIRHGWLPWAELLPLALIVLALALVVRRGPVIGATVVPALYILVLVNSPDLLLNVFFGVVAIYLVFVQLSNLYVYEFDKLRPETQEAIRHLRVVLRPVAIAFPILYLIYPRRPLLTLIGSVALVFIVIDLVRLASKRINVFAFRWLAAFFREHERYTFSTATLFLMSSFLTILLFSKPIATSAIIFLIFGDLFAKFTGLEHGRWRIFGKTLDGTLAYFVSCLLAGFVWSQFVPISWPLIIAGSLAAALAELLPLGVNDNFVIPLISAAAMRVVQLFF